MSERSRKRRKIESPESPTTPVSAGPSLDHIRRTISLFLLSCERGSIYSQSSDFRVSNLSRCIDNYESEHVKDVEERIAYTIEHLLRPRHRSYSLNRYNSKKSWEWSGIYGQQGYSLSTRLSNFPHQPLRQLYRLLFTERNHEGTSSQELVPNSKSSLISGLDHAFRTGSTPLGRREEEKRFLASGDIDLSFRFVTLGTDHDVPQDLFMEICRFVGFGTELLESVALVSWDWFVAILCCWDAEVVVSKKNVFLIPLIVLRRAKALNLIRFDPKGGSSGFLTLQQLRYLWKNVHSMKKLAMRSSSYLCSDIYAVLRSVDELDETHVARAISEIVLPRHARGKVSAAFQDPGFCLASVFPNLVAVSNFPAVSWLQYLSVRKLCTQVHWLRSGRVSKNDENTVELMDVLAPVVDVLCIRGLLDPTVKPLLNQGSAFFSSIYRLECSFNQAAVIFADANESFPSLEKLRLWQEHWALKVSKPLAIRSSLPNLSVFSIQIGDYGEMGTLFEWLQSPSSACPRDLTIRLGPWTPRMELKTHGVQFGSLMEQLGAFVTRIPRLELVIGPKKPSIVCRCRGSQVMFTSGEITAATIARFGIAYDLEAIKVILENLKTHLVGPQCRHFQVKAAGTLQWNREFNPTQMREALMRTKAELTKRGFHCVGRVLAPNRIVEVNLNCLRDVQGNAEGD